MYVNSRCFFRIIIFIFCILIICNTNGQTISTIGGNGININNGDNGLATNASIGLPTYCVVDKFNNIYLTTSYSGNSIRKISSDGIITTIAGQNGVRGYSGDGGLATNALSGATGCIRMDARGDIIFGDETYNVLRKINMTTGIISTIAGTGVSGYNGDNIPATEAKLSTPGRICYDSKGNIIFGDEFRLRKINSSGIITTIMGNGIPPSPPIPNDSSMATSVSMGVIGLTIDKYDNLFVADEYAHIYKIDTNGMLTYFAGNGISGMSGDGGLAKDANMTPSEIELDKYGNLFLVEYSYNRIRMINSEGYIFTLVGNGIRGFSGDGGLAYSAEFAMSDAGLAFDSCDNLYFCDLNNNRIRKVTFPHCNYMDVNEVQNSTNENFTISPNPTTQYLYLSCNEPIENVYMCNAIGQKVFEAVFNQTQKTEIDIGFLPAGIYYVCVNRRQWGKVVKE